MVDQLIIGVLTWCHIVSVIAWSGAAITFLITIGPTLSKLTPQANGELVMKMFPRFVRSIQVFTLLTLTFGPLLALTMNDGPPNAFDLVTPWSRLITAGAIVGVSMFFIVFLLLTPSTKRLKEIVQQMQRDPQQPPPTDLPRIQKRLAIGGPLSVGLLLLAEAFMVAAAQF